MEYRYTVYTADRKTLSGSVEALSDSEAENALLQRGYLRILQLTRQSSTSKKKPFFSDLSRVSTQDIIDFSRDLSSLIKGGVPIISALQSLEEVCKQARLKAVITELISELVGGKSFSEAVGKQRQIFSSIYYEIVRASEFSGNLEVGLSQIAEHMEKQLNIRKAVTKALLHPIITLALAVVVFMVTFTIVLPPLIRLFQALNAELPITTKILINVGKFVTANQLPLVTVTVALVVLAFVFYKSKSGKKRMDRMSLRIPIIGGYIVNNAMFYFCQTMSAVLRSGIPIVNALDISKNTIGNSLIRASLEDARDRLIQGNSLPKAMASFPFLARIGLEMIAVGERVGEFESAFTSLERYYERRIDESTNKFVSFIEPALTVTIGLVVGLLAISIISPVYSIAGSFGN